MKIKKLHPAFFVFSVIVLCFGYGIFFLLYLVAIVIHELAHAIVARRLGYKLENFYLMPYGAALKYQDIFAENDELKIAIAGPIASLFAGFLTVAVWWIFPGTYNVTQNFVLANFALAIFNFLPAFPLDGGRVLINILSEKMPRSKALKIAIIFNYVFSGLFLILFVISIFVKINFNFLIVAIFLFIGVFDGIFQGKYQPIYATDKTKMLSKGVNTKITTISCHTPLFKAIKKFAINKYNVILILLDNGQVRMLTENTLKMMMENYDLKLTFYDIYSKLETY